MFQGLPNPSKPITDNDIMDAYLELQKQSKSRSSSPTKSLSKLATLPKALKPIHATHQEKLDSETVSIANERRFTEHLYDLFGDADDDPIFGKDGLLREAGSVAQSVSPQRVPLGKEVAMNEVSPSRFSTISRPSVTSTTSTGLKTKDPLDLYLESAYSALDTVNVFDPSAADVLYRVIKWLVTDARVKPEEVAHHKEVAAKAMSLVSDREKVIETLTKEKQAVDESLKKTREKLLDTEALVCQLEADLEAAKTESAHHLEKIARLQSDLLAEEKKFYDMRMSRDKLAYRNTELVSTGVDLRSKLEDFIKLQKNFTINDETHAQEVKALKKELERFREQYDDDIVAYQQIVSSKTELISELTAQCNTAQNDVMMLKDKLAYLQSRIMGNKADPDLKDASLLESTDNTLSQSTKQGNKPDDTSESVLQQGKKGKKPVRGIALQIGGDDDGAIQIYGEDGQPETVLPDRSPTMISKNISPHALDLSAFAAFLSKQAQAETAKVDKLLEAVASSPTLSDATAKSIALASNGLQRKLQVLSQQVAKYKELFAKLQHSDDSVVTLDIDTDGQSQESIRNKSQRQCHGGRGKGNSSDGQLHSEDIKILQMIQSILGDTFTLDDLLTNEDLLKMVSEAKFNVLLGKLRQKGCSTFNASSLISEASEGHSKAADNSRHEDKGHATQKGQGKGGAVNATSTSKTSKKNMQKNVASTDAAAKKKAVSVPKQPHGGASPSQEKHGNNNNHNSNNIVTSNVNSKVTQNANKIPQDEASQLIPDFNLEKQMLQKISDISQIDLQNAKQQNSSIDNIDNIKEGGDTGSILAYDYLLQNDTGYTSDDPALGGKGINLHYHQADLNVGDLDGTDNETDSLLTDRHHGVTGNAQSTAKPTTAIAMNADSRVLEPPARIHTPQDHLRDKLGGNGKHLHNDVQRTPAMYTVTGKQESQFASGLVVKATGPLVSETPSHHLKYTPSVRIDKKSTTVKRSGVKMLDNKMVFTPGQDLRTMGTVTRLKNFVVHGASDGESSSYSCTSSDTAPSAAALLDSAVPDTVQARYAEISISSMFKRKHKEKSRQNKQRFDPTRDEGVLVQLKNVGPRGGAYTYIQMRNDKSLQYESIPDALTFMGALAIKSQDYEQNFERNLFLKSQEALLRISRRMAARGATVDISNGQDGFLPTNSILGGQHSARLQSVPSTQQVQQTPMQTPAEKTENPSVSPLPHIDGMATVAKKLTQDLAAEHHTDDEFSVENLDLSGLRSRDLGSFEASKALPTNRSVHDINVAQRVVEHFRVVGQSMHIDELGHTPEKRYAEQTATTDSSDQLQPVVLQIPSGSLDLTTHKGDTSQPKVPFIAVHSSPRHTNETTELIAQANMLLKKTAPILIRTIGADGIYESHSKLPLIEELKQHGIDLSNDLSRQSLEFLDDPMEENLRSVVVELAIVNKRLHDELSALRDRISRYSAMPVPSEHDSIREVVHLTHIPSDTISLSAETATQAADSASARRLEIRTFYPPRHTVDSVIHNEDYFGQRQNPTPLTNSSVETTPGVNVESTQGTHGVVDMECHYINQNTNPTLVKRRVGYEVLTHVAQVAHEPIVKHRDDIIHQSELYAHPLVDPLAEQAAENILGESLTYDAALSLAKSSINKSIIVTNKGLGASRSLAQQDVHMQIDPNEGHLLTLSRGPEDVHDMLSPPDAKSIGSHTIEGKPNKILFRNHAKPLLEEYTPIKSGETVTHATTEPHISENDAKPGQLPVLVTTTKPLISKLAKGRSLSASGTADRISLQLYPIGETTSPPLPSGRVGSCKIALKCANHEESEEFREHREVEQDNQNSDQEHAAPESAAVNLNTIESAQGVCFAVPHHAVPCRSVSNYGEVHVSRIHVHDNCEAVPADLLYKEPTDEEQTRKRILNAIQLENNRHQVQTKTIVKSFFKHVGPREASPKRASPQTVTPKASPPRSTSPSKSPPKLSQDKKDGNEPHLYTNAPLSPMHAPRGKEEDTKVMNSVERTGNKLPPYNRSGNMILASQKDSLVRSGMKRKTESTFSLALKKEELRQRNELAKHINILEAELALEKQRVEMARANPIIIASNFGPGDYPAGFLHTTSEIRDIMVNNIKNRPSDRILIRGSVHLNDADDSNAFKRMPSVSSFSEETTGQQSMTIVPMFRKTEPHQHLAFDLRYDDVDINEYASFDSTLLYGDALNCLLKKVRPLMLPTYQDTLMTSEDISAYINRFPELRDKHTAQDIALRALQLVPAVCPSTEVEGYIRSYDCSDPATHTYPLAAGDKVAMVFYKNDSHISSNSSYTAEPNPMINFLVSNTTDVQILRYNETSMYAIVPCPVRIKAISWLLSLLRTLMDEIVTLINTSSLIGRDIVVKKIYLWAKKKYGIQSLITNLLWHLYCSVLFYKNDNAEVEFFARVLHGEYDANQLNFYLSLRGALNLMQPVPDNVPGIGEVPQKHAVNAGHTVDLNTAFSITSKLFPMLTAGDAYEVFGVILDNTTLLPESKAAFRGSLQAHMEGAKDKGDAKTLDRQQLDIPLGTINSYVFLHILMSIFTSRRTIFNMCLLNLFEASSGSCDPSSALDLPIGIEILQKAWPYLTPRAIYALVQRKSAEAITLKQLRFRDFVVLLAGLVIIPPTTIDPLLLQARAAFVTTEQRAARLISVLNENVPDDAMLLRALDTLRQTVLTALGRHASFKANVTITEYLRIIELETMRRGCSHNGSNESLN